MHRNNIQNMDNIQNTLHQFHIQDDDIRHIQKAGELIVPQLPKIIDLFYEWLKNHKEFNYFFHNDVKTIERVQSMQFDYWVQFFSGHLDERYFETRRHVGYTHGEMDLNNDLYVSSMSYIEQLFRHLIAESDWSSEEKFTVLNSLSKLIFMDTYLALDEITLTQKEKISQHSKSMLEMSTPIIPIWNQVLLLPLLGIVDSSRTSDIMVKALNEIDENSTKVLVMDISGVKTVDTGVANQLMKVTKATKLMGCETIISGVSPSIAQTVVELGIDVGTVKTTSTLKDALEIALTLVGDRVVKSAYDASVITGDC